MQAAAGLLPPLPLGASPRPQLPGPCLSFPRLRPRSGLRSGWDNGTKPASYCPQTALCPGDSPEAAIRAFPGPEHKFWVSATDRQSPRPAEHAATYTVSWGWDYWAQSIPGPPKHRSVSPGTLRKAFGQAPTPLSWPTDLVGWVAGVVGTPDPSGKALSSFLTRVPQRSGPVLPGLSLCKPVRTSRMALGALREPAAPGPCDCLCAAHW